MPINQLVENFVLRGMDFANHSSTVEYSCLYNLFAYPESSSNPDENRLHMF